jgi:lysophospholipid acyltransferase (LPLAT)-like uncharacterized protein
VSQEPARTEPASFSRGQRFKARLIGLAGYVAISIISRTVRWRSEGDEHLEEIHKSGRRAIFTFWHGRIFPATYYWRNRGIVVMTSMNLDGEAIDGPRGPRYVAKQGPVLLAFKSGAAILCFHISMKHKIQLKSWDEFQIPLPFTTAIVLKAPPIWVPADANEDQLRDLHSRMQTVLDELRIRGDAWFD